MEEYTDPSTLNMLLEEQAARKMEETKRKQQAGQKHKFYKHSLLHSKLNNNYTNQIPMCFWKTWLFFNIY